MNHLLRQRLIKTELERIFEAVGRLTPADVLEVATEEASPLHGFFEWDDSVAAEKHRLNQASGLIRSVRIRITKEENGKLEDLQVRGWVAARAIGTDTETREGYLPESEVRADPALKEAVLRQMRREIQSAKTRYRHLDEFWELLTEVVTSQEQQAS